MNAAATLGLDIDLDQPMALELCVLGGPQLGARAPLHPGQAFVLALSPGAPVPQADVVLRDPAAEPALVRITAHAGQALLQVLQGTVQLGTNSLPSGAEAPWASGVPLALGQAVVAWGERGGAPWLAAAPEPAAPALPALATPRPARRPELWLATVGAALLLACGAAWAISQLVVKPPLAPPSDAAALASAIKATEFAALQVQARPGDTPKLSGRLATVAQRQRLDAWLAARQARPALDVQVDETLVAEVSELFRLNGVPVKAQAGEPGQVLAEAAEPDATRLARVHDVVRRDVRGLAELQLTNTARPAPPPAPPVPADPGKRIASLVPGEPAYVVTADGARYFVGAVLPSGHRIADVQAQTLTLERDGQQQVLNF